MMKNVPQGWRIEKLGNLGKIRTGKKDANHNTPYGEYEFFTCAAEPLKSETYSFDGESLIMAGNGANVGLVLYYKGKFEAYQRTYVANELSENPRYIYYHLKRFWSSHNDLKQFGSATNYIKLENLTDYPIQIPPLPQQEKIVSVLDTASALVEKQKALLKKYDLFLKSKFIEMFGDPVKNPMGWEIVEMREIILDVKNGLSRRSDDKSGQVVLKLKDIRINFIRYSNLNRIELDEKEKHKYSVEAGDLLFIRVNGNPEYVGRCAIFDGFNEDIYFNDHIMRVKVKTKISNSLFLAYLLNLPYGKMQIHKYRKTSAGQHTISQDGLERVSVFLPPIELQGRFAQIVEQTEIIKQKEEQKLEKMQTLYDALMKRAFNGEIH